MRPILNLPTATRACSPSKRVYRPALACSSSVFCRSVERPNAGERRVEVTYNGFGAALQHACQGSFGPDGEGGMNICAQGGLARALRFDPFQFRDVGRDATDRIGFFCAVPQ